MKKETSAGAVVFFEKTNNKNYFLNKQTRREYLLLNYLGGHWDLPRGHIEMHENPIETVLREVEEETQLKVKIIKGFERKITFSFKHENEFVIKDVIFYLAKANSQKVILSEEHKGYVWLPYREAKELITFNKDILEEAEIFLRKMNRYKKPKVSDNKDIKKKGFSFIEILLVLITIVFLIGLTSQFIKPSSLAQRSRDVQRIADIKKLDLTIKNYILATTSPFLGPNNKGIDESSSTIFLSLPLEKISLENQTIASGSKIYYLKQVSSTVSYKIDGSGWLPIDFSLMPIIPIFSLPVDPLNEWEGKFFYVYAFKRSSTTYELNTKLENSYYINNFSQNDLGDNENIFEAGTEKTLIPNNLY